MGGRVVRTLPLSRPGRVPWHESDEFWRATAPFFFDAEHWERAPGEVAQIIKLLGLGSGDRARDRAVLDLACGPGRHSLAKIDSALHLTLRRFLQACSNRPGVGR